MGDSKEEVVTKRSQQDCVTHECPRTGAQIEDWDYKEHVAQWSTKISDQLYLGNQSNAMDLAQLRHPKDTITHVVVVIRNGPTPHEGEGVKYSVINLDDLPNERLLDVLSTTYTFIDGAIKAGGKVLVHDDTGKSRSASVIIAYLMKTQKLKFKAALSKVNKARKKMFQSEVAPNHGFQRQLRQYEKLIK